MKIRVDTDDMVPMRDGTRLATDIHRPASGGAVPALLMRTPYHRELGLVSPYFEGLRFARSGFAVVTQDVRGRGASEGSFSPFTHEASDGVDTIRWIRDQPWCSGQIGMIGPSYVGATQWLAAGEAPDGLSCIAPIMTPGDYVDGWIRRGRALEAGFNTWWALTLALDETKRRRTALDPSLWPTSEDVLDALDRLGETHRSEDPVGDAILHELAPFLGSWIRSDAAPVPAVRFDRVTAAPLIVGGWYDIFLRGTLMSYERIRAVGASGRARDPRLIIGPWSHNVGGGVFDERDFGARASLANSGIADEQQRWLRRWLLDGTAESDADTASGARIFVMGPDVWRELEAWPPPSEPLTLYLGSDGDARTRSGSGRLHRMLQHGASPDAFVFDPADPLPTLGGTVLMAGSHVAARAGPRDRRAVEDRPDVLCYETEPLRQNLELIGAIGVGLWVHSTAPTMDFTAVLVDVSPTGRAEVIADGIVRIDIADPGVADPKPTACRVDLGATAVVLGAGHRIRLEVSSSDAPRFDLPPRLPSGRGAVRNLVFHDAERRSRLDLPVTSGSM